MQKLKIFQVDAFSSKVFSGNPAAIVPLTKWLEDAQMLAIAAENNLSETAFFVPEGDDYALRWFTPVEEVRLCGHATLASGFVILTVLEPEKKIVRFKTLSGILTVERAGDSFIMDLPATLPEACEIPPILFDGLKTKPHKALATNFDTNYYVIYDTGDDIRNLQPDMKLLEQLHPYGVVVTAPGAEEDFVARYFAPSFGVPEDPVTGSIYCGLVPFWADRLGKTELCAKQLSKRGGELFCKLQNDRVLISGTAAKYLEGEIYF